MLGANPQKFMDTTVSEDRSVPSARSRSVPSGYSWIFSASRTERSFPSSTAHTPRDTVPWRLAVFFSRYPTMVAFPVSGSFTSSS